MPEFLRLLRVASAGNAAAASMASPLTTEALEAGGAFPFALDGFDEVSVRDVAAAYGRLSP